MSKSKDYISWDDYFMNVAMISAFRSKDPNTKVGACVVNEDKIIVGIGYNGLPKGCSDDEFPWSREGEYKDTKYAYVVHAEVNAILNHSSSVKGGTIYVSLFPCNECAKVIIQSGIKEVVYLSDKYNGDDGNVASKKMLESAGVKTRSIQMKNKVILVPFE